MESHVEALKIEIKSLTDAMQNLNYVGVDDIQKLTELTAALHRTEQAVAAANRVMNGQSAQLGSIDKYGRGAALGILELSRALEDVAVAGPLGGLNNVPGMIMGIGQ